MIEILEPLGASSFFTRLGWTMLHSFWLLAILGLAITVSLSLMRNCSSNVRYTFGYLGLCLMMVLPVVVFCFLGDSPRSDTEVATNGLNDQAISHESLEQTKFTGASESETSIVSTPINETGISPETRQSNSLFGSLAPWLSLIWLSGIGCLTVWHLGGWWTACRMCKIGISPTTSKLSKTVRELKSELNIKTELSIFESAIANVPLVIGWLRPTVLIPVHLLEQLSGVQLRMVLAHELAHVRRHDYLANLIQTTIDTFLFFHPMAWWVSKKVRAERENCCDDLAVERCGESVDLASALVAIESARMGQTPSTVLAANGGNTSERVFRLLGASKPRRNFHSLPIFSIVALILIATVSFQGVTTANADDEEEKWGPLQNGLQMRLTIENNKGADENLHRVTVEIANRRDKPISFHFPSEGLRTKDWNGVIRRRTEFDSVPASPKEYFQVAAAPDLKAKTLPPIAPGKSIKVSWIETATTLGQAQGFLRFNRSGTYGVSAGLTLLPVGEKRIRLTSNQQDYVVAGSDKKPLRGVGKLSKVNLEKNTAQIDVGNWDALRVGDQFSYVILGTNWKFTVLKTNKDHSDLKFEAIAGQPRDNAIVPIDLDRLGVKHNPQTTPWRYVDNDMGLGVRDISSKMAHGDPLRFTLCWRNFGSKAKQVYTLAPVNCSSGLWWFEFRRVGADGKTEFYYGKAPEAKGDPVQTTVAPQKTLAMPIEFRQDWSFETQEQVGLKQLPPGKYEFWIIGYDKPIELSSPLSAQSRPYSRTAAYGKFEIKK